MTPKITIVEVIRIPRNIWYIFGMAGKIVQLTSFTQTRYIVDSLLNIVVSSYDPLIAFT